jgi:hypothetical protein
MVGGDGRVTSDQVVLVGVAAQVGTDERTERDELEPTDAEVLQGAGDQPLGPGPIGDAAGVLLLEVGGECEGLAGRGGPSFGIDRGDWASHS